QEILVLNRLLYRNRSQHRSAKYFTLALEVRRACRTFAAPDVPELLAKGLSVLARVPDSRNGRAREAWVRSAAAALQRMSVAAVACAEVMEATVQASKHLAHQISQTYFMALSVVFMACLARLFVCSLHLGGRLLEVHGALLRTLLAQPSTSECLPAAALAACGIPEETATFLSLLRGAGRASKLRGVKAPDKAAAAAGTAGTAAASSKAFLGATPVGSFMSAPFPTAVRTSGNGGANTGGHREVVGASGGLVAGGDGDGDDSDDTGVRIGRAVAVEQVEKIPPAGKVFRGEGAAATKMVERQGGRRGGKAESDAGRTGGEAEGGSRSDGGGGGRDGERRVEPPRKKVVLASEFSDSSDDESDNSSITKPERQQQQQQHSRKKSAATTTSLIGAEASRSGSTTPPRPSLPPPPVFSSANKPPRPQPSTSSITIATASVSPVGGTRSDGSGVVGVDRASGSPEEVPPGGHVGWMIDRGPAFAATPPRCTNTRGDDAVPSSSAAAATAAAATPHGEEAPLGIPGAPSDVADDNLEGTRGRVDGLTVGVDTSSDGRSVDNVPRAADATTDVPDVTVTQATTCGGTHMDEGRAISCVTGVEASTAEPGAGGVAGDPPTPPVGFFRSYSSAVDLTSSCTARGEKRRKKNGKRGKEQVKPKGKGPPSSLPTPSMPTPRDVDGGGGGGYDRKVAAPSPTDRAVEEAVSDCRRSRVVGGNHGEGADRGRVLAARGGIEKKGLGGIGGSTTAVSLPQEPASRPDAVGMSAAVYGAEAVAATAGLPPAAPSHRKVDEKESEEVGSSSLPSPKLLQQRGSASRKERLEPTNSGAGDKLSGGGSGAKRSPAGEARGELTNRKKKKTKAKKGSNGATKRSAGGQ
ncbi:unnamed protein product, partial [Laminaria digitata]